MAGIDTWPQRRVRIPKRINEIANSRKPNVCSLNLRLPQWPRSAKWSIKMKTNPIATVNRRLRTKIPATIPSLDQYRAGTITVRRDTMWTTAIRSRPARIKTQMVFGCIAIIRFSRASLANFHIYFSIHRSTAYTTAEAFRLKRYIDAEQ